MIKKLVPYLSILLLLFGCKKDGAVAPKPPEQPLLPELPTITTLNATNVSGISAISGGTIVSDGGDSITVYGLCWSVTQNPTTADAHSTSTGNASTFNYTLTGLTRGSTYFVRAYASNSVGTAYGNQVNFTTDTAIHVYVSGSSDGVAVYWKDGVPTFLTNAGTSNDAVGYSIYVANNDVYVAGYEYNGSWYEARVWKNAVGTTVSDPGLHSEARAVTVVNNDVYVVGSQNFSGNNYAAKVWKNGTPTTLSLPGDNANPKKIVAVNNDIYIGGYEEDENSNYRNAVIWKNNIPSLLYGFCYYPGGPCTFNWSEVNDIFIAGSDVYAVGTAIIGSGISDSILWKNGIPTRVNIFPSAVFVSNNDVYIAGRIGNAACLWKNGTVTMLTDGINQAYANSVFVMDNDVYVVGSEKLPASLNRIAKLWKNGVATNLTDGTGIAMAWSVFVQ